MSRRRFQESTVAHFVTNFFTSFLAGCLLLALAGCAPSPRSVAPAQPPSPVATESEAPPPPPPPPQARNAGQEPDYKHQAGSEPASRRLPQSHITGQKPRPKPLQGRELHSGGGGAPPGHTGGQKLDHAPVTSSLPIQLASASIAGNAPLSSDQQLAQEVANLKKGTLLYKPPPQMKTGQTAHIVARIGGHGVSMTAMQAALPDQGGPAILEQTPVSTRMKMTLTGADFTVTPLSTEEQFVAGDTPTTWEWDIVPKHAGTLSLHLAAVVELDGMSRDYTTVDRDIRVKVDPLNAVSTFVGANSIWVLTTLGAGVVALWGWWRKRKKPEPPK